MIKTKPSLYLMLGMVIMLTVVSVMTIQATYTYVTTKNKTIQEMKRDSKLSIVSLQKNVTSLIESYALNEYLNLTNTEIERRDSFAIVVEDYNMGKLLGQDAFISGKIRDDNWNIVDYDSENSEQLNQLSNCYYTDSAEIRNNAGEKLGLISIYVSDRALSEELQKIVSNTIVDTVLIILLLTLMLFISIKNFILKPVSDIVSRVLDQDKSGIPLTSIPQCNVKEINTLGTSINNMIDSVRFSRTELEQQQIVLRSIIDSTPDLIFVKDLEGVYLRCNKAFEEFFGSPERDIINKTDFDFVDAEMAEFFREHDNIMLARGVSQINEETVTYPDGHEALLETLKTPLKDSSGNVLGLLGVSRNITQQRRNEQDLHIAGRVFNSSNEGILVTNADNNIIHVNPAFCDMVGYQRREILGKNPRMFGSDLQSKEFYQELWQALNNDGMWIGEIWNRRKSGETYPQWLSISTIKDKQGKVQQYIAVTSDVSESKKAQDRIAFLAQHDVLTGLPNRSLLSDRLQQAILSSDRNHQKTALLFLDLDRFKFVNDSLGHNVGDKLLLEVAERLINNVREEDTVSRTGGDEFTILLINTDEAGAANVAQSLIDSIAKPFEIDGHSLFVTLSIGISIYPDNGDDSQALNQKADTAMYRAKQSGRNQYQFFTDEMHTEMLHKIDIENDLRAALERKEFELVYQPQIDINSHKITGCEALIRWKNPNKGYISPVDFIPIAEETGLINSIGDWVLRTAAEQLAEWIKTDAPEFIMAVNLSGVQFNNSSLVTEIKTILQQNNIPANNFEVEITESTAMKDIEFTTKQLQAISDAGILISLDDFGTGYSSLSYLKKFPINKLKIDQGFVFDMLNDKDDEAIVDAVITLAQSLGLETIAEGVETKEHMDALQIKGCDQIQGYYFSKPISAGQFSQLLASYEVEN